ncbi:MAG: ABC transporter substrate-binding protein [Planctomycetes bacterium]|nr:ABC transporter substrate-binding protein [Planctomycetota bacterium]MCD7897933.1 ABC transporter substrate-binding protein [Planctomycetaceae bacterium]
MSRFQSSRCVLALLAAVFVLAGSVRAAQLTMYVNPIEAPYVTECVKEWMRQTGNEVTILTGPAASSDVLALYQQQLAAGTSDVDIYEVDVIWPGLLANHLLDLTPYSEGREKLHTPPVIANNTVNGRLVAMPLYLDAGMMYYRKDLLDKYNKPIPATWPELTATAKAIVDAERAAGNQRLWGLVFQGRAYEGLTCTALEWIDAYGGGTIVDADGKITVNNPAAVQALKEAASWIGTITPEGALNYAEEESRGVFQSGDSVFMRNWPYAWALAEEEGSPVKGKIGIMPVPAGGPGGKSTGALGGWGLAVSKYSKNPELAADLLFYLTSAEGQKKFSLLGTYTPSVVSLFSDPEIQAKNPVAILEVFNNAVPRPAGVTGSKYNRVSSEFYNAVHAVLSKKSTPEDALRSLEASLRRVSRGGW